MRPIVSEQDFLRYPLNRSGFISRVGGGRKHQYEIRFSDRLMQIVLALFQAEKDRHEQLISKIKTEIKNLKPHKLKQKLRTLNRIHMQHGFKGPPKKLGNHLH